MLRTLGQRAMLITGLLACPCHLPLMLPLAMGLIGGTALGAWVSSNMTLVYILSTAYFVVALLVSLRLMRRRNAITAVPVQSQHSCVVGGNEPAVQIDRSPEQTLATSTRHP